MIRALRHLSRSLVLISAGALLAACASTPTPVVDYKPDYDFTGVKKIGFLDESAKVSGDNPLFLSDMQVERIDSALANELGNKGFTIVKDAQQADLLISWHLATQNKTDVNTYETPAMGVGYGSYGRYNRYSMYSCWNCTNTEVQVRNYTEGTFIVDMIDPRQDKSVWRSVTQTKLKGKRGEDPADYTAAAAVVLGGFPPGLLPAQ